MNILLTLISLISSSISISAIFPSIQINRSIILQQHKLCQTSDLCKIQNCDIIKTNVTDIIRAKGTKYDPPDNTGGWTCLIKKGVIRQYCAYGIWQKNITREISEFRSPDICRSFFNDTLGFQSLHNISVNQQSVNEGCKIIDYGEQYVRNVDCAGVKVDGYLKVQQQCGNKVTNIIRNSYILGFNFDVWNGKNNDSWVDISYFGSSFDLVESSLVESSLDQYRIEGDNENKGFIYLKEKCENRIGSWIMKKVAEDIRSQIVYIP